MGAFEDCPRVTFVIQERFRVDVYDVVPEEQKFLIPVIICPGWVEVPISWSKHIDRLVELGYRVIAFDAPHGLPIPTQPGPWGYILGALFIERQKMATLIAIMNAMNIKRADLIGRSEGAMWALLTAHHHSERVRNIVLQNPAGLIGQDWIIPFLIRWRRDMRQTALNEENDPAPYAPVPAWTVWAQSYLRTAREVIALMFANSRRQLCEARVNGHKVALITTDHDRLFPVELIRRHTEGLMNTYSELRGSHTSFFCRPAEFADTLAGALEALAR